MERRFSSFFSESHFAMFEIFAFMLGIGLALSSAAHAAVLLAVSLVVALASLADTLARDSDAGAVWPFVRAWMALAALQLGFVLAAGVTDAAEAARASLSRWRTTSRRDRNA